VKNVVFVDLYFRFSCHPKSCDIREIVLMFSSKSEASLNTCDIIVEAILKKEKGKDKFEGEIQVKPRQ